MLAHNESNNKQHLRNFNIIQNASIAENTYSLPAHSSIHKIEKGINYRTSINPTDGNAQGM